tara:strand:+ start:55927 stop:56130 length:204 start_codon:yes stop_codon:yes gene_type:complete
MRDIKSDLKYRYIEVGNFGVIQKATRRGLMGRFFLGEYYWADFAACSDKEYMADFFRRHYSEIILNS